MLSSLPLKDYTAYEASHSDYLVPYGETWVNDFSIDNHVNMHRKASLGNWWTGILFNVQPNEDRSLLQFWPNFFSIEMVRMTYALRSFRYLDVIRNRYKTSFRDLLIDLILSQTIFHYVRKIRSTDNTMAQAISDIILRLYVVGPDYLQNTSKEKIKRLRRLLNQWSLICDTLMVPSRHQQERSHTDFDINVFSHLNPVQEYVDELHSFIEKLFLATPMPLHLARKMFVWMNNREVSPSDSYILEEASHQFTNSDFNILSLYKSLNRHAPDQLQSPFEFVIRVVNRRSNEEARDLKKVENYNFFESIRLQVEALGQQVADVPPGELWRDYQLSPGQQLWLSERLFDQRNQVIDSLKILTSPSDRLKT